MRILIAFNAGRIKSGADADAKGDESKARACGWQAAQSFVKQLSQHHMAARACKWQIRQSHNFLSGCMTAAARAYEWQAAQSFVKQMSQHHMAARACEWQIRQSHNFIVWTPDCGGAGLRMTDWTKSASHHSSAARACGWQAAQSGQFLFCLPAKQKSRRCGVALSPRVFALYSSAPSR